MEVTIENIEFLLLIAALVAMLAQRVRIPYTVGLVLAGIGLSFLPFMPELELSKELIFSVLLPPLIFEATLFIRWRAGSQSACHLFSQLSAYYFLHC